MPIRDHLRVYVKSGILWDPKGVMPHYYPAGLEKEIKRGFPQFFLVINRVTFASQSNQFPTDDQEMFKWVKLFNPYDLYSKKTIPPDWQKLKPYYEYFVAKYLPKTLNF